jgi:hypothetical protein
MNTAAMTPCPHGNHVGFTRPHPELRMVCSVCGGPRVQSGAPTAGSEVGPLRETKRAFSRRRAWRVASTLGAVVSVIDGSIGALLAALIGFGYLSGAFFAMAVPFALLLFVGLGRSAAFSRDVGTHLAEAWKNAARDVAVAAKRPITAAELAQQLGATESEADHWLAQLTADDVVKSEVTDEGQIRYAPAQFGMRIDPALAPAHAMPAVGGDEADPEEAALEARFAELARKEREGLRGKG